jgi:DMSO reductase family type II enzyme heme b subunit
MKIAKVSGGATLADPGAPAWASVEAVTVPLQPVPLGAQPTSYIREAWAGRPYGQTPQASLAAATDGERLYVRVSWKDDERPHGEFQDAVAAVFPTNGSGAIATLGDAEKPVAVWFWENGGPGAQSLLSRGPGVVRKDPGTALAAAGELAGGNWSVVFGGPLAAAGHGRVAVAVWNGSNDERGGLAAVSRDWVSLEQA